MRYRRRWKQHYRGDKRSIKTLGREVARVVPVQPGTREPETRSDCPQGFPRLQGTLNVQSAHMTADGAGAPRHALIMQPASVRPQENGVTCCLEKDKRGMGK